MVAKYIKIYLNNDKKNLAEYRKKLKNEKKRLL